MTTTRRRFLTALGGTAGLAALGGRSAFALPSPRAFSTAASRRRTLVLIQLSGGNDGLSTLVPYANDDYRRARPTLRIGADRVLKLDDAFGLHPNLKAFRNLYDRGALAVVRGVGYPDPIRSHFESFDIWHAADHRGRSAPYGSGWIGRFADACADDGRDPVVHVGDNAPYSLVARRRPPVVFTSPDSFRFSGDAAAAKALDAASETPDADSRPATPEDSVRRAVAEARKSAERVREATSKHKTKVEYPRSPLSAALKTAAALVSADAGVRVFSTELGGFDTHVGQAPRHDALMATLDGAVGAFQKHLTAHGRENAAVVFVFSEFGRRTAENGSGGTDHGAASTSFILGDAVRGGMYGEAPSLADLERGDMRHTTDFRSIYATLLERWCGADADLLLDARFDRLAFL